ncbi:uncharacterized protein PHALS_11170 [Plasmopara halstedii]|uniref:Uncharacterized protein n=1 Tax=Plasmopara halstedii TaxID=4781 RepID=A0A0P1AJG6_PLAHL|nr:uncharacterized protein PHALS_11170 [Plasmopara halstedii]CEG40999.1 hypothetical protein PHALS_11170 [Plasmopara halstedii]|eukprot:XP_024577368.1 hypothetical protein PHALS_11170 [Plasmopara halstedii]
MILSQILVQTEDYKSNLVDDPKSDLVADPKSNLVDVPKSDLINSYGSYLLVVCDHNSYHDALHINHIVEVEEEIKKAA